MMMGKEKMGEKIIKIPNYTLLQVVLQKVPFFVLFKSAGPSPEQTHAIPKCSPFSAVLTT